MIEVYPESPKHVPCWIVIREHEGVRVVRAFSAPPPENVLSDDSVVIETCLDYFDVDEQQ